MHPLAKRSLAFLRGYWVTLILVGFIAYKLAFTWVPVWVNASQLEGTDVSHLSLVDERGNAVSLASFRGAPLILNFWATWCLPCLLEIPQLRGAYDQLSRQGKQLVGVNFRENWRAINAFRAETEMPYPIFLDRGTLANALGITIIPAMVVIDREGRVDKIVFGYRPWMKWYLLWWI